MALFTIALFIGLLGVKIETWKPRIILFSIALAAFILFGMLGAMVSSALLSVGILLASKMPRVSKL